MYLTSTEGDSVSVSSITGSPTAVHLYNVQEYPNDTTGALGIGANNQYYGVYRIGGTSPTYTATYYYRENDAFQLGGTPEADLQIYVRDDNTDLTWTSAGATVDSSVKTLTATAQNTEFILGSVGIPLPVSLLEFNAEPKNGTVILTWITASEINNDYFIIQKSQDLRVWENCGEIEGAGNSRINLYYEATDESPFSGTSYYRLQQVDFDGSKSYSNVEIVSFDGEFSVFPNPFSDELQIVTGTEEVILSVQIFEMNGRLIYNEENLNSNSFSISGATLPEGVFMVQITTNKGVEMRKMVHE